MKKKILTIALDEEEVVALYQLLLDRDADEALAFLQKHARGQVRELLDQKKKIKVNRGGRRAREQGSGGAEGQGSKGAGERRGRGAGEQGSGGKGE